ncbi:hypothetical protein CO151_03360 [bacterium CG_4_9_14_3_um_filter_65_15]|nr:MAG: hypothetical protein CO151_03360 [bacterium CG_4_9_14_3_um_filter_65_15]
MEWDAEERDAWVPDAQRWIGQIKGVLQSKIELDESGDISGVHVVSGFDREPRHIVRDVESLLKARLGIDVYYKKIGVVQVLENGAKLDDSTESNPSADEEPSGKVSPFAADSAEMPLGGVTFHPPEDEPAGDAAVDLEDILPLDEVGSDSRPQQRPGPLAPPTPAVLMAVDLQPRILCRGVGIMVSEDRVRAEVRLEAGEREQRGLCERPNHPQSESSAVAEAALDAMSGLLEADLLLHLVEITTQLLGGQEVVLVAVNLVEGRRSEMLFGTCSAVHNRQQAVVFAVLDALNRRLSQYPLQEAAAD